MDILFYCGHTITQQARSGVQRVVIETAKSLQTRMNIGFVKWDEMDGQLRYLDERDIMALFGGSEDLSDFLSPYCHRVAYRFGDTINTEEAAWLLFPEIPYHLPSGNEIFARIISQCREYGVSCAAIFYDLIPIRDDGYKVARADHIAYVTELLRCDLVFPISHFAGNDLIAYCASIDVFSEKNIEDFRKRVIAIPLGENSEGEPWGVSELVTCQSDDPVMVMVGTVEPRKRQTNLLKVLNDACKHNPDLQLLQIEIFGSLHPACSDELYAEMARNPKIRFHQYGSEEQIEQVYARAWFSAFPSCNEGYGLPIVESLKHGVPCVTSNFGSMAEVAAGGGCLTINTLNDSELVDALVQMCSNAELRERLRTEIPTRKYRSWGTYADDILMAITNENRLKEQKENLFRSALEADLCNDLTDHSVMSFGELSWNIVKFREEDEYVKHGELSADRAGGGVAIVCKLIGEFSSVKLTYNQLLIIADADVLHVRNEKTLQAVIQAACDLNLDVPLPHNIFFGGDGLAKLVDSAVEISKKRNSAQLTSYRDSLRAKCLNGLHHTLPNDTCNLAVVISTYNRGSFVEMNVDWLLREVGIANLNVHCVVLDNASTDDTYDRLSKFFHNKSFSYKCNSANVGMLGNLRQASILNEAKYVWLIGDDDFIVPGAIERTLNAINENPGVPFLFHNFEVYHRESLGSHDSPKLFMGEAQVLGTSPQPSGLFPVNKIAEEHDNLYTAIYPIVFKSDVLAGCFNYPFDGVPFINLVESVPTTKMILGNYRYSEAYWFEEPGINGNAHNSWSSHRPRWHLVLMPQVFDLARDAGVDPKVVLSWTKLHLPLFYDSVEVAISQKVPAHLSIPSDMDNAYRVFWEKVKIPNKLAVF